MTFTLDFGDGYPHASHMTVKDRQGKTTAFDLDGSNELRFVPRNQGAAKSEIVLKMGMEDAAPDKIEGTYKVGNKQTPFTLRRVN